MIEMLAGVEECLCASSSKKTKAKLKEFYPAAGDASTAKKRKKYEVRLEQFLQSKPCLRGASRRYLAPKVTAALNKANRTLRAAEAILTI